jgi:hypothetical protein
MSDNIYVSPTGQGMSIGGSDMRSTGLPGGGGRETDGRPPERQAPATPAPDAGKPASAEALAALDAEQEGTTDRPPLDDDDRAEFSAKLKAGWSAEDAARHMGLTSAELRELQGTAGAAKPAPEVASRASTEKQLADIRALRRSNPKMYWTDAVQARELSLLQALNGDGTTVAPPPKTAEPTTEQRQQQAEPESGDPKIAKLDDELAKVKEAQRTARGAELDRLEARELEIHSEIQRVEANAFLGEDAAPLILDRWNQAGGVEARFAALVGNIKAVRGMLGDQADAFAASLDGLPLAFRVNLMDHASVADGDLIKQARAAMRGLEGSDLAKAQAWFEQWRGVIEGRA